MLSSSIKKDWPVSKIKEVYEEMIEYFEGSEPKVVENFEDEFGQFDIDGATLVYVPIECEEGLSEAISLTFDSSNNIIELEFGRP